MILKILLSILFFTSIAYPCKASYFLKDLTLEEKVGQILMVHFNGESVNEEAKLLINKGYVGNFIYYNWSNGLTSPTQVRELSSELQKLVLQNPHPIPLIIAVDQEGGRVSRLNQGFTHFPGNNVMGMTKNPSLAEREAFAIGQELLAVGVNMNLAPVVDVNCNNKNPKMGLRMFSNLPDEVADFSAASLKGYRSIGVISCLKHFPGHGDVKIDSHEDLPHLNKSRDELVNTELFPFAKLANQADVIMTAHLLVHAMDPENCTTLSKPSLDFLRNTLGFNGVILTDSLVMEGLLKNCPSIEEAAIKALNAGCDLILLGGKQLIDKSDLELSAKNVLSIHEALVSAVQKGSVSENRLNEAVQRILTLKNLYLSKPCVLLNHPLADSIDTIEHHALVEEIIQKAIQKQKK